MSAAKRKTARTTITGMPHIPPVCALRRYAEGGYSGMPYDATTSDGIPAAFVEEAQDTLEILRVALEYAFNEGKGDTGLHGAIDSTLARLQGRASVAQWVLQGALSDKVPEGAK